MVCPKCGQPLQDDWIACPKCGISVDGPNNKTGSGSAKMLIAGIAALAILLSAYYFFTGPPSEKLIDTRQPTTHQKAIVLAAVDESQIVIINGNDFAWIHPELSLLADNKRYSYKHPVVPAKGRILIDLSNFVSTTGEKFNGLMVSPDYVTVTTDIASGEMKLKQ